MISPIQIRYILALLKHKNFQSAAESCHVTQPTLSMQLKKAEEAIGHQLFNRDTQPISLTLAGKKLLPYFTSIEDNYQKMKVEIQKLEGNYNAEIRIGIIPTISLYLVPEFYIKWQNEINDYQIDIIELTTEKMLVALKNKEIDFGIMAGPLHDEQIYQQILYNEEILLYAPLLSQAEIELDTLKNEHPWLLSPGNCLRTQMINFCEIEGSAEKKQWNYEGGNLNLLIRMVEKEGGYTLLPQHSLPYLSIPKEQIKSIANHRAYRQIIGIALRGNSKREEIIQIMRLIQRDKANLFTGGENLEMIPWDA